MNICFDRKCILCRAPHCNAKHILSCCPTSPTRFAWRHDWALLSITEFFKEHNEQLSIFAYIDGHRASKSPPATVPASILHTLSRPDTCIVEERTITFLELTVPWNSEDSIQAAALHPIEIGCLGHYKSDLASTISSNARTTKLAARSMLDRVTNKVIESGKRIFDARNSTSWSWFVVNDSVCIIMSSFFVIYIYIFHL